jgi:hypothetical protein
LLYKVDVKLALVAAIDEIGQSFHYHFDEQIPSCRARYNGVITSAQYERTTEDGAPLKRSSAAD